jgi:two-component system LytT family response regulator
VGQQHHLVRGTIASCAERLDPARFARVHRRYVVNLDRVKEIQPWFGGDYLVLLHTGHKLRMSRTFREPFMSRMFGA